MTNGGDVIEKIIVELMKYLLTTERITELELITIFQFYIRDWSKDKIL